MPPYLCTGPVQNLASPRPTLCFSSTKAPGLRPGLCISVERLRRSVARDERAAEATEAVVEPHRGEVDVLLGMGRTESREVNVLVAKIDEVVLRRDRPVRRQSVLEARANGPASPVLFHRVDDAAACVLE